MSNKLISRPDILIRSFKIDFQHYIELDSSTLSFHGYNEEKKTEFAYLVYEYFMNKSMRRAHEIPCYQGITSSHFFFKYYITCSMQFEWFLYMSAVLNSNNYESLFCLSRFNMVVSSTKQKVTFICTAHKLIQKVRVLLIVKWKSIPEHNYCECWYDMWTMLSNVKMNS